MAAHPQSSDASAARECYRCREVKPLDAFIQRVDHRYFRMCRACVREILAERSKGKTRLHHTATHRTCYLCRRFLPVDQFTRRRTGSFFSGCKECNRHVFAQRRRARLADAQGSYTVAQWRALLATVERCPHCNRRWEEIPPYAPGVSVITVDHIVPLARGGPNDISNIQPLCYSCNSKKGDR